MYDITMVWAREDGSEVKYPFLRTDKTEVIRLLIEFLSERPHKIPVFENLTPVRYEVMIVRREQ